MDASLCAYEFAIYEPFEQEHQNGSYPSGTGLGLSIVKQLVDFMQGDIQVTSVLQKGTTFTLKFHFAETNACVLTNPRLPLYRPNFDRCHLR